MAGGNQRGARSGVELTGLDEDLHACGCVECVLDGGACEIETIVSVSWSGGVGVSRLELWMGRRRMAAACGLSKMAWRRRVT
jgi:hypothetical protein